MCREIFTALTFRGHYAYLPTVLVFWYSVISPFAFFWGIYLGEQSKYLEHNIYIRSLLFFPLYIIVYIFDLPWIKDMSVRLGLAGDGFLGFLPTIRGVILFYVLLILGVFFLNFLVVDLVRRAS